MRFLRWFAALYLLVGVVFVWVACTDERPTIPDPVVPEAAAVPEAVKVEPQAVAVDPGGTPTFQTSWRGCVLTIEATRARDFSVKAFTHNQGNIWSQNPIYTGKITVKRGHNVFDLCFILDDFPGCRVQIDVGNLLTAKWIDGHACPEPKPRCVDCPTPHPSPSPTPSPSPRPSPSPSPHPSPTPSPTPHPSPSPSPTPDPCDDVSSSSGWSWGGGQECEDDHEDDHKDHDHHDS